MTGEEKMCALQQLLSNNISVRSSGYTFVNSGLGCIGVSLCADPMDTYCEGFWGHPEMFEAFPDIKGDDRCPF